MPKSWFCCPNYLQIIRLLKENRKILQNRLCAIAYIDLCMKEAETADSNCCMHFSRCSSQCTERNFIIHWGNCLNFRLLFLLLKIIMDHLSIITDSFCCFQLLSASNCRIQQLSRCIYKRGACKTMVTRISSIRSAAFLGKKTSAPATSQLFQRSMPLRRSCMRGVKRCKIERYTDLHLLRPVAWPPLVCFLSYTLLVCLVCKCDTLLLWFFSSDGIPWNSPTTK